MYSVGIIDYDKTEFSSSLIKKMKEYSEIELVIEENLEQSMKKLARGKYDVVYEVKEGYQNKILSGEFYDILVSHKEVNSIAVKWINDQISLLVVRDWLYVDAFSRIRSLDPSFKEIEFKQKFEAAMADNKILSLEIHKINEEEGVSRRDEESMGSYIFKVLWGSIMLFFVISFGKKIVDDREKGIIVRLELSGLARTEYYITNSILPLLSSIIPFTVSYILMGYFNFKNIGVFFMDMLLTIMYIIITWIFILLIGFIFNSKKSYNLASQVFLLVSIILGTGLLEGMSQIIKYISWIFPFKWYIIFIAH